MSTHITSSPSFPGERLVTETWCGIDITSDSQVNAVPSETARKGDFDDMWNRITCPRCRADFTRLMS